MGRSKAALVGLGGGGSHIAQQLAHIGLGSFLPIDPDFIEDTNLNRLVGATMEDVKLGTAKVDIAERVIKAVNPAAEVNKRRANWTEVTAELRDVDVIFACVDSIGCRSELEAFARRFLIPLIDIGMDVHESSGEFSISGQVMLSMPGKPCMRCMGLVTDEALAKEAARYGAAGGKPQVVWPNGTLASIAVGFFMKLVTPWETHKADAVAAWNTTAICRQWHPATSLLICLRSVSTSILWMSSETHFGLPMLSQLSNRYTRMRTGGRLSTWLRRRVSK